MSRLRRLHLDRRRALVAAGVAVTAVVALVLVLANPFGGGGPAAASTDNGTPTTLYTVRRQDLSEQTQVSATLGYADPSTVALTSGTAPANVQQAQDAAATAYATLADDTKALDQAHAMLEGDARKLAIDCAGSKAAESGGGGGAAGGSEPPCTADAQAMATDRQTVASSTSKVQLDERAAASAGEAFAQAESSASLAGPSSSYTMLPVVGKIARRGGALYGIGGESVILLYGGVPQWRAFASGMSPGRDVAELNANLRALGYGSLSGDAFTSATESAIARFQSARGLPATGSLLLGAVVFEPGAVRITSVTPTNGAPVQPGPVLGITSVRRVVTIALDASQQSSVKVGDAVDITLPDNSTTPGRVTYVGSVATTPSSSDQGGGGSGTPTIEVDVTPDHPGATGRLDQAPVDVSITTATVDNALVVPVNALLALAGGGYAVEVVTAGVHSLVGVSVGLFDDAEGLVQVGGQLRPGQRVVVPSE
jgi:peptidoglycan hydrolase-like protein with peptidoglycan-binding domain